MRKVLTFLAIPVATAAILLASLNHANGATLEWVITGVPLALVSALVLRNGLTLPAEYLKRWTKAHGVAITEESGSSIRRYLLRGRRIRTIGALGGYIGFSVYIAVTQDDLPFGWVTATFAGYLIGAAAAEIWAVRPQRGSVRIAALAPRRLSDYVPRTAIVLMRAVPAATILLAVCAPVIPTRPELASFRGAEQRPDALPIIAWTVASAVLWVLVEWTARRIVDRPQPVESEDAIAMDDAVRSTALHGLIGAGLALMLGSLSRNLSDWTGLVGPQRLAGLFTGIAIVAGIGTILAWLRMGIDQTWIVKRTRIPERVQAA
jgi:hypothetical protein